MGCASSKQALGPPAQPRHEQSAAVPAVPPARAGPLAASSDSFASSSAADTLVASALRSKRARGTVILGDAHIPDDEREAASRRRAAKPADVRAMLQRALLSNVLFGAYGAAELSAMVDALEPCACAPGEVVIQQGAAGDAFYVIEAGRFEILKDGVKVADWGDGTGACTFGELALMYNSPRAATVRCCAVGDAGGAAAPRLWRVDRRTFRGVVAHAAREQHAQLKRSLRRGILEGLTEQQLDRVADAATIVRYGGGEQIIRKGEAGEVFFIIEEGAVLCRNLGGDQANNLLQAGDYFGERALLTSEPRAADVFAQGPGGCTLIALHRDDFTSLLGHLRELLEFNVGMRLLLCMPVLASLSDDDRAALFGSLRVATFARGQPILPAGAVPTEFYIVKEGGVRVVPPPTSHERATGGEGARRLRGSAGGGGELLPLLLEAGGGAASPVPAPAGPPSPLHAPPSPPAPAPPLQQLLHPGHFFPPLELAAQAPLACSYVASSAHAPLRDGEQPPPSDAAASALQQQQQQQQQQQPVQCFVTDRATYMRILAPYVVAAIEEEQRRTAAAARSSGRSHSSGGGSSSSSSDSGARVARPSSAPGELPPHPLPNTPGRHAAAPLQPPGSAADPAASKSSSVSDGSSTTNSGSSQRQSPPSRDGGGGSSRSGGDSDHTGEQQPSAAVHSHQQQPQPQQTPIVQQAPVPLSSTAARVRGPAVAGGDAPPSYATHRERPARRRLGLPFNELEQQATMGTGTFGRVRLVTHRPSNRAFALKMLQKAQVVALKQQANILNERALLWRVDHPFIIKLFDTYRDRDRLYMLLELVQGGELFSRLQHDAGRVSVAEARFYAACVLDALDYMHSLDILYRDLKPENLLIDSDGYLKLVDFGFAKVVRDKTYTLCGTPEYLAPELVLGRGHDKGVDYWALGVLLFEMVSGSSPFADHHGNDQMVICRNILRGDFEFPAHVKDKDLRDLISRLLVKDVTKRLGCMRGGARDVKAHRFFRGLDWDALARRQLPAPWTPALQGALDTSHFDEYDEKDEVMPYTKAAGIADDWDREF